MQPELYWLTKTPSDWWKSKCDHWLHENRFAHITIHIIDNHNSTFKILKQISSMN